MRVARRKPARATWRWSVLGFLSAALAVGIGWIALANADLGGIPTRPGADHAEVVELLSERRGERGWVTLPDGYERLAEDGEVYLFVFDTGQEGILFVTEYGFFDAYTGLVYTYDGSEPTGNENPNVTDDPTGLYGTVKYAPLGDHWFRVGAT